VRRSTATQRQEETTEAPSVFAARAFAAYCASASMDERRELGQFFTPPEVAFFMAELARPVGPEVRILVPGAGTAILTASVCERLAGRAKTFHIDVYELHPRLASVCEQVLAHTGAWLAEQDIACTFVVHRGDFVLENASYLQSSLFNEHRDRVLTFIRSWPETLHTLGLSVSTVPVVAFRALEFLHEAPNGAKEVPLLWLQHVRMMEIQWPLDGSNKRQYIANRADSKYLLLPNATYVVMRRFSAKEAHRRIVACPLFALRVSCRAA
jgi:hypothetical protein